MGLKTSFIHIIRFTWWRGAKTQPTDGRHAVCTTSRSLGRYTVVMFTMGVSSSSCSSLEAIAHVGVPNIAVLAMCHDAQTSTTWSILPCCFKTLRLPGWLSGEHRTHDVVVGSLRRTFFPAYFRLSPLLKHVRKVVGGLGKKVVLVLV